MIKDPFPLICALLLIESAVLFLASHPSFKKYFRFLPSVFWIYFLPMMASTFGLIDPTSFVYGVVTRFFLPASLFLLLISVDLKMIARLGRTALFMFFAGSLGIMLGTVIVFSFVRMPVGAEFGAGFAALSASWMGGSANMVAVKEALAVPDAVFLPLVIVDTIVPYFWMGILVAASAAQTFFDRFNRAETSVLEEMASRISAVGEKVTSAIRFGPASGMIVFGILVSAGILWAVRFFPKLGGTFSSFTWAVITASLLGLACSMTPVRRLEAFGSERIGYFLLYFVLTTIGARASIEHLADAGVLIAAGFAIVFIHAVVLIVAARVLKAPMFLAAVASQANIGGAASAPIVAEIYRPGMAAVGLLMAVVGSVAGTYLGLAVGKVCAVLFG